MALNLKKKRNIHKLKYINLKTNKTKIYPHLLSLLRNNVGSLSGVSKIGYLVSCGQNIYDMLLYFNVQYFSLPKIYCFLA